MDTVSALDKIFLFRIEEEAGNAWKVAFQTEGETDESREYETTATKDGSKKSAGAYEGTHSITSLLAKDDEYIGRLRGLIRERNPKRLEVWEIDRSGLDEGTTLPGDYSLDVVTNVNMSAGSEGDVEISIDTEIDGAPVAGEVEVTPELSALLAIISEEREFVQPTGVAGA